MDISGDQTKLRALLTATRTIAVVGASPKPERDSHKIAKYLLDVGYRMIPVNPAHSQILGETCFPDLKSIPQRVDMVDLFRRAEDTPPIVEDAIAIQAKSVWFQLETRNDAAIARAIASGLTVVADA